MRAEPKIYFCNHRPSKRVLLANHFCVQLSHVTQGGDDGRLRSGQFLIGIHKHDSYVTFSSIIHLHPFDGYVSPISRCKQA